MHWTHPACDIGAAGDHAGITDRLGQGAHTLIEGRGEHGVPDDRVSLLGPEHVDDHAVDQRGVGGVEWHVVLQCGCGVGVAGSVVLPVPRLVLAVVGVVVLSPGGVDPPECPGVGFHPPVLSTAVHVDP